VATARDLVDAADRLLQGEPARFIGYGAALVIVGVVAVANQVGVTRFGENVDLGTSLGLATAAIVTVTGVIESIRKFVFSPATVADIVLTPPTAEGPIAAAEAEGVDVAAAAEDPGDTT
jgi:hypothetical protein